MAGRFPGSENIEKYWDNLKNGRDLVTEVPEERWPISQYFSEDKNAKDTTYSKWAGHIKDIDLFDAGYFKISEENAKTIDPQQRIMLELTQELLDRAGYEPKELSKSQTGVFIGASESSYGKSNLDQIPDKKHIVVNSIQNMISARISDFYNLKGPSYTIDTACSSSLVSIHQASKEIQNGECELAIAGGIELLLDPFAHVGFSQAGILSDEPKSYIFDERAKGIVLGEGAGLVLLKDYEKAVADGDQIYGVITASAVNNDGKTMGLTVPNLEGQKECIKKTLAKNQIDPSTITYLEAHGTGTLLGDPIEIKAATQIYRQYTK
ncbi:polyketide synthase, partial [Candidatus Margulisiibacteriota bacterium]